MSDDTNGTPDGGADPNTARELQRARNDLTSVRAEMKTIRGERDAAVTERDDAIKSRDGYKGQIEKQRAEYEGKLADQTKAADDARSEAEKALSGLREASDRAVIEAEAKAGATRLGAHSPADLVRLLDLSGVARGEDGAVTGLDEALAAAKEARGYMFGEAPKPGAETGTTAAPPRPRVASASTDDVREIDPKAYAAKRAQFLVSARS